MDIVTELRRHHAFANKIPDSTAQLLACSGSASEVVDVVRQLCIHLSGGALPALWGTGPWWDLACGTARRFAY